jgi:hypothetical protein
MMLLCLALNSGQAQTVSAAITAADNPPAKPEEKKTPEATQPAPASTEASAQPPPATNPGTDPGANPVANSAPSSFLKSVNWTIILDAYYAYNFNRPDDNVNVGFYMEPRHNRPTLSMAKLNLEKQSTLESPFGFRVDAVGGPGNQLLLATKDRDRGLEATRFLWQAYVSYTAPLGKGLTIDFGKFGTPIGMEGVDTKDNFNYSHSFLFNYGPFYHTGLRAKYAFNDKVSVTGYAVNAWDSIGDTNSGKTFGLTVSVAPHKKVSLSQTYLTGPENPRDNGNWRNVFNTLVTYTASDRWTFLGDFVYGNDRVTLAPQRGHWTGFAGFAKYAINDRLAVSGRFDVFRDEDALWTGLNQTLHGYTVTQEVKLLNNLISKFEFRRGVSNQPFFTRAQNQFSKDQNVALLGVTWFFTNKK